MTNNDDWSERPTSIAPQEKRDNPSNSASGGSEAVGGSQSPYGSATANAQNQPDPQQSQSAGAAWSQQTGQPAQPYSQPGGQQPPQTGYPSAPQQGFPAASQQGYQQAPYQSSPPGQSGNGQQASQQQQYGAPAGGQPPQSQSWPQNQGAPQGQTQQGYQSTAPQQPQGYQPNQGMQGAYAQNSQGGPYPSGNQPYPQQRGPFARSGTNNNQTFGQGPFGQTATSPVGLGAKVSWGLLAGGLLALLGIFGAWITLKYNLGNNFGGDHSGSVNGLGMGDTGDKTDAPWKAHGYIILILALVAIGVGVMRALGKLPKVAAWAGACAGFIILALSVYDWSDIHDRLVKANDNFKSLNSGASFSGGVGWGLILTVVAALVTLVCGAVSALRD